MLSSFTSRTSIPTIPFHDPFSSDPYNWSGDKTYSKLNMTCEMKYSNNYFINFKELRFKICNMLELIRNKK